jgi:hypothetical protein
MQPTADPHVAIEEHRDGYTRYRRLTDGRRWEVWGYCDRNGACLIGAVIDGYGIVRDHDDIENAKRKLGRDRIDSELDVPVTPEFSTCCGRDRFRYVELDPAGG